MMFSDTPLRDLVIPRAQDSGWLEDHPPPNASLEVCCLRRVTVWLSQLWTHDFIDSRFGLSMRQELPQ
jgi:hypothetical protein